MKKSPTNNITSLVVLNIIILKHCTDTFFYQKSCGRQARLALALQLFAGICLEKENIFCHLFYVVDETGMSFWFVCLSVNRIIAEMLLA